MFSDHIPFRGTQNAGLDLTTVTCSLAERLLDEYTALVDQLASATTNLAVAAGVNDPRYEEFRSAVDRLRPVVICARDAYQQHLSEHRCRHNVLATQDFRTPKNT